MTADTSVVVAALSHWHEHHDAAAAALAEVRALPAHAALETYSVLTRLPSGLAVPAQIAARELAARFPDAPLRIDASGLLGRLADAAVSGGSTYDGLVALEAAENDHELLTLDRRAQVTYARLGTSFRVVDPAG